MQFFGLSPPNTPLRGLHLTNQTERPGTAGHAWCMHPTQFPARSWLVRSRGYVRGSWHVGGTCGARLPDRQGVNGHTRVIHMNYPVSFLKNA